MSSTSAVYRWECKNNVSPAYLLYVQVYVRAPSTCYVHVCQNNVSAARNMYRNVSVCHLLWFVQLCVSVTPTCVMYMCER